MACSFYIEKGFEKYKSSFKTPTPSCEIWSHRGIVSDSLKENTIKAFAASKDGGATGIEVDVFWIDSLQECIVMHDMDTSSNLRDMLNLTDVVIRFKDSLKYWIDLKNLTNKNAPLLKQYFQKLVQQQASKAKVCVESGNADALASIKTASIQTIYWIQFNRSNPIRKWLKLKYLKRKIANAQFDGYSVAVKLFDPDYQEYFSGLPTYLFHGTYKQYKKLCLNDSFNIQVVLVDQDYYQLERN